MSSAGTLEPVTVSVQKGNKNSIKFGSTRDFNDSSTDNIIGSNGNSNDSKNRDSPSDSQIGPPTPKNLTPRTAAKFRESRSNAKKFKIELPPALKLNLSNLKLKHDKERESVRKSCSSPNQIGLAGIARNRGVRFNEAFPDYSPNSGVVGETERFLKNVKCSGGNTVTSQSQSVTFCSGSARNVAKFLKKPIEIPNM